MWQIKQAPSQLTGAGSLVIPIKDISYYLRIWQLGHLHHTSSGSLKLLKKRRKRSLSSLLLILGELTSVKHWVTLRLSLPPEEKAVWTSQAGKSPAILSKLCACQLSKLYPCILKAAYCRRCFLGPISQIRRLRLREVK